MDRVVVRTRKKNKEPFVYSTYYDEQPIPYSSVIGSLIDRYFNPAVETLFLEGDEQTKQDNNNRHEQVCLLREMNACKNIDDYFIEINRIIDKDGLLIGSGETAEFRKEAILSSHSLIIGYIIYFFFFCYFRVMPKLSNLSRRVYLKIQGKRCWHVLPKSEILGRLVRYGFDIEEFQEYDGILYFVARKAKIAVQEEQSQSGPIFRMKRIGARGKPIHVYKFRTMHPYAEYLQGYIMKIHGIDKGGKFRDDFRITTWGRFMRKYWIDELPMVINVIKGDIKIIGVRPLSEQYFSLYPADMQLFRNTHKPGLVPPFYADMPTTFVEIIESERQYFHRYDKRPMITDLQYLCKITFNIVWGSARSK